MKNSGIIVGLVLFLILIVGLLILPFALGWAMNTLMLVAAVILVIGLVALIACIVWLALRSRQEKAPEPILQTPIIEEPKAEPSHLTAEVETPKAEPSQTRVKEVSDRGSKIVDIEGIGSVYAEKLNSIDIYTTTDLLAAGATPLGRKGLAEKTGISGDLILRWVNMSDLFRIKGVGEEYSDLLEAAGVDTVVELAQRVPANLHAKMLEVNAEKKLVRRTPTLNEVTRWIEEAKTLGRKVEY